MKTSMIIKCIMCIMVSICVPTLFWKSDLQSNNHSPSKFQPETPSMRDIKLSRANVMTSPDPSDRGSRKYTAATQVVRQVSGMFSTPYIMLAQFS